MFERIFRNKVKEAAAAHETKLNKRLAERLKHYNADEDDSVSNFSDIDFKENSDKTSEIKDRKGNVDVWGQANPAETTQWNKENQVKSDRRQTARRKLDCH
jgi:threonine aldolase